MYIFSIGRITIYRIYCVTGKVFFKIIYILRHLFFHNFYKKKNSTDVCELNSILFTLTHFNANQRLCVSPQIFHLTAYSTQHLLSDFHITQNDTSHSLIFLSNVIEILSRQLTHHCHPQHRFTLGKLILFQDIQ